MVITRNIEDLHKGNRFGSFSETLQQCLRLIAKEYPDAIEEYGFGFGYSYEGQGWKKRDCIPPEIFAVSDFVRVRKDFDLLEWASKINEKFADTG